MTHKGIAALALLIALAGIAVVAGGGYVWYTKQQEPAPLPTAEEAKNEKPPVVNGNLNIADLPQDLINNKKIATVSWKLEAAAPEGDVQQRTKVTLVFRGVPYEIGTYNGGCAEVGARPGIDGKGLLSKEGELAAVQCWYAGAGDEVGLFKVPEGFSVQVGELGEGEEGAGMFRGNFVEKLELE